MNKDVLDAKLSQMSSEEGLTPRQAIQTKEFALLSTKIMLTELVFFYLLFVYKVRHELLTQLYHIFAYLQQIYTLFGQLLEK